MLHAFCFSSTRFWRGIAKTDDLFRQTMQHVLCTSAEHSPQTNPIVARIDRKSGHGCGRSTQKIVNSY